MSDNDTQPESSHESSSEDEFNEVHLTNIIEEAESVLKSIPDDDPHRVCVLNNLAIALQHRYEQARSTDDLDVAIQALKEAAELTSNEADHGCRLNNLGKALYRRFEATDSFDDLKAAIEIQQDSVKSTPDNHPHRESHLYCLSVALQSAFERSETLENLDALITARKEMVRLSGNHYDRAYAWRNLSDTLRSRYTMTHSMGDLDAAIEAQKQSLNIRPDDDTDRVTDLRKLNAMLEVRFDQHNALNDLNEMINIQKTIIRLFPGPPMCHLNRLGNALKSRYEMTDSTDDLNASVEAHRRSVKLTPAAHRCCAGHLRNLGNTLKARFQRTGQIGDLDKAVAAHEQALETSPDDQVDYLNDLGVTLQCRFERRGLMEDLDKAILLHRKLLELTPDHSDRSCMLNNLGNAFHRRFERSGSMDDMDAAVKANEEAVKSAPRAHRATHLINLGNILQSRFERTGSADDLNAAVEANEEAAMLAQSDKGCYLNSFGLALVRRFERTGRMADLDAAVEALKEAVQRTPESHQHYTVHLTTLGVALSNRFNRTDSMGDIDECIEAGKKVDMSTPHNHPDRACCLNNLAVDLERRARRTGLTTESTDLNEAVRLNREAIESTPIDHPHLASHLNSHGIVLMSRLEMMESVDYFNDINEAVQIHEKAVSLTPDTQPQKATFLFNLGMTLHFRFGQTKTTADLNDALNALEMAVEIESARPTTRINAARYATEILGSDNFVRKGKLLKRAVELLPLTSPRILNHSDQQYALSNFSGLVSSAAAVTLRSEGTAVEAVQLLEIGRGVMASLQLDTRTDVTSLEETNPKLAKRFKELQDELDLPNSFQCDISTNKESKVGHATLISLRHALAKQFDSVIAEIRTLKGFERFLLGPSSQELMALARPGPIVIFNVADAGSDALLITKENVRNFPLPALRYMDVEDKTKALKNLIHQGRAAVVGGARVETSAEIGVMQSILEWLWETAVSPVLDELGFREAHQSGEWPHVWWITSGRMSHLPIHAAGYHTNDSTQNTISRVISSYTLTIKSLVYARERAKKLTNGDNRRALLVGMSKTPRQLPLPGAEAEIKALKALIEGRIPTTVLLEPCKDKVSEHLQVCEIAHFACHGESDLRDPSKSRLLLDDWESDPLSVAYITTLKLENAQLAYLSACSASDNQDEKLLDEGIHLTGACQLAGFPSVVGSLWHVSDKYSVKVATDVYSHICANSSNLCFEKTAAGLHSAVRNLKNVLSEDVDNVLFWGPYIHIGA